jgi:hypothetical protein
MSRIILELPAAPTFIVVVIVLIRRVSVRIRLAAKI